MVVVTREKTFLYPRRRSDNGDSAEASSPSSPSSFSKASSDAFLYFVLPSAHSGYCAPAPFHFSFSSAQSLGSGHSSNSSVEAPGEGGRG